MSVAFFVAFIFVFLGHLKPNVVRAGVSYADGTLAGEWGVDNFSLQFFV